jgi:hypothetical protein
LEINDRNQKERFLLVLLASAIFYQPVLPVCDASNPLDLDALRFGAFLAGPENETSGKLECVILEQRKVKKGGSDEISRPKPQTKNGHEDVYYFRCVRVPSH